MWQAPEDFFILLLYVASGEVHYTLVVVYLSHFRLAGLNLTHLLASPRLLRLMRRQMLSTLSPRILFV